jgi:hypothetical protein
MLTENFRTTFQIIGRLTFRSSPRQVGRIMSPHNASELDLPWNRAHFGAWCCVSAPLILGIGLDDPNLGAIIPIITNPHALAVSQSWAGHPGTLISSLDPGAIQPDAAGYVKRTGALLVTDTNLRVANVTIAEAESWCSASAECAAFTFRCNDTDASHHVNTCTAAEEQKVQQVYFKTQTAANGDPKWATFVKEKLVPAGPFAQQIWVKPLPGGSWAVLAINGDLNSSMSVALPLSKLNMSGPVTAIDIWNDGKLVPGGPVAERFQPPPVGPRDSGFFKLSSST